MLDLDALRDYVHRMFLTRSKFGEFIKASTGFVLPKSFTYKAMLGRIEEQLGTSSLLETLSLNNETEAIQKINLIELFVNLESEQLRELGTRLKTSLNEDMNRGDLTRAILVNSKLECLLSVFKALATEKFIVTVDSTGLILGPLGITTLKDNDSINAAIVLIQFFKNSETQILDKIAKKVGVKTKSKSEKAQAILSKLGSKKTFDTLSNMILSKQIFQTSHKIPQKLEFDKRYGIRFIDETPIETLSSFLCDEFNESDLKPHLNPEYGSFRHMVLAYCIQNDPSKILDVLMGAPQLRKCVENRFGIEKKHLHLEKKEIISTLLFHMGFFIPESPTGLINYIETIEFAKEKVTQSHEKTTIVGCITSAFIETEKLLKDLILFYGAYLTHEKDGYLQKKKWEIESIEREILKMCHKNKLEVLTIEKASFGKLVGILRVLEKYVKQSPKVVEKLNEMINRTALLDTNGTLLQLLDEISSYRKFYVHDVEQRLPSKHKTALTVFSLMLDFAQRIRTFYPTVISGQRIVIDNFGTAYLIAKDEQNKEYTIYSEEKLDSDLLQNQYLMKQASSPIVINPILVIKP